MRTERRVLYKHGRQRDASHGLVFCYLSDRARIRPEEVNAFSNAFCGSPRVYPSLWRPPSNALLRLKFGADGKALARRDEKTEWASQPFDNMIGNEAAMSAELFQLSEIHSIVMSST